jgi:molybdate transport system substrate-binding protein
MQPASRRFGPIDILSSMATRQILADLAAAYERQFAQKVAVRSMGGVDATRLVRAGEVTDVVLLASGAMEQLEAEGWIVAGSRVDFARSKIAMAVRSGALRPDIGDEVAVKDAILAARKLAYSTGPSGAHLARLLERWGIAEEVKPRLLEAPVGVPVASLLARGQADLGFQQMSELTDYPGVDVIGALPPAIQNETIFSAGVAKRASNPEGAREFIAFLMSRDAEAAKKKYGMDAI